MKKCIATLLLLVACPALPATPLFEDHAVIDVTLRGPFTSLFADLESLEYYPYVLEASGLGHDIKVRLRGHSRRTVCAFPPLRLNFPDELPSGSVFEGQDKLKVVTHCRNYDRGEQDMLEEYLAYRMFNVMTEASFKVRLLRFHYEDPGGEMPEKARDRLGFVIESDDEIAARLGATEVVLRGLPKYRHDREQAALVYVFHYVIANTDWALGAADSDEGCCHNHELFERDGSVLLVPFDFDLSGIVNAEYAFPHKKLPIKRVTQRVFRGPCMDREVLRGAIRRFVEKRGILEQLVHETPGLSKKNVTTAIEFLDGFYKRAADEERLLRIFERRCIG